MFVMLLPYRVKVLDTKVTHFTQHISTLHMFISITFTETIIDERNKTQQEVRGSKFMFEMSTIHANTCIQTTMPLRTKNYENPSMFVKVTAKKSVAPFFWTRCIFRRKPPFLWRKPALKFRRKPLLLFRRKPL